MFMVITPMQKQNGAALVVGLLVLLVMTMLGIASMGSMTTELRIANNVQTHQSAFEAATAGFESVIGSTVIEWNDTAAGVRTPIATQPAPYVSTDGTQTAQLTVNYSGCLRVFTGSSLTSGGMAALAHEIQAVGQSLDANGDVIATSRQVLGIQSMMVAGC